ncbi:Uncharacterised protein [Vibrio cholerae]|nr:Uncharacterised protein [Vibrio cholerae]
MPYFFSFLRRVPRLIPIIVESVLSPGYRYHR